MVSQHPDSISVFISKNILDGLERGDETIKEYVNKEKAKLLLKYNRPDGRRHDISLNIVPTPLHVDVNIVENDVLDLDAFKRLRPDLTENAE